uniref:Uncharacterized protein n=1 Tax=Romanomermis culicivorax TaxID=13658 RepID=A0A915HVF8_ROMCU
MQQWVYKCRTINKFILKNRRQPPILRNESATLPTVADCRRLNPRNRRQSTILPTADSFFKIAGCRQLNPTNWRQSAISLLYRALSTRNRRQSATYLRAELPGAKMAAPNCPRLRYPGFA